MPSDLKETYESLPGDVQKDIMNRFHRILMSRGLGDEWRLANCDEIVGQIVNKFAENGVDIMEYT